jgi:hypothetical protein
VSDAPRPPTLGFPPRAWQADVARRFRRWNIAVVHRRAGKTVLAVDTLAQSAAQLTLPHGRYAYVCPLLKQAKRIAWTYFQRVALQIGARVHNQELWIEMPHNGARIQLLGADAPDSLRGDYLDGLVLDEVAQMRPEAWGEVLRPQLADRRGWALIIGTPKGVNLLSERYHAAIKDPRWSTTLLTLHDTQALAPAEIEELQRDMTVEEWRQEMLCDFAVASPNQLFGADEVRRAQRRDYQPWMYQWAPRVIGVDVAGEGDDRSVVVARQGVVCFPARVLRTQEYDVVAALAADAATKFRAEAIFVDAGGGWGAAVVKVLRELGFTVFPVEFGGAASDPRYANKRAEIWWRMKTWLKEGGALPAGEEWVSDLCGPTYGRQVTTQRLLLEAKANMKRRGLASPDLADALATTFAFELPSRSARDIVTTAGPRAYDPFAHL